jgi:NADH-quinone oxidoreductase subunit C
MSKQETAPATQEPDLPESVKQMAGALSAKFGSDVKVSSTRENRLRVDAKKENVVQVAEFIRDEMNFDHAESVSGVDYPNDGEIEVVYHLGSYTDEALSGHIVTLVTRAPREEDPRPGSDSTRLPSLRDIFYSVEFHERECFEMLGVYFEGHPDNRRLLLPEDWADLPPLRKDFKIKGR